MARLNPQQDDLFVSPDNLVIDHQLDHSYKDQHGQHSAPQTRPQPAHQGRSFSLDGGHRPGLSLSDFSAWNSSSQQGFRLNLPPTPHSPFGTLRPLTEEDKLAFPCPGGPQDCWNIQLCPKHRDDPRTPSELSSHGSSGPQTSRSTSRTHSNSPQALKQQNDQEPRNKLKRSATEPEDDYVDSTFRPSIPRTISRDTRAAALSRGRVPHNLVERRYRDNLNHQIELLRLTLPSLRDAQPCPTASTTAADYEAEYSSNSTSPRMPSKAVIIQTAASYIQDLQNERSRLVDANKALQEQVCSLQKLVRCDESNVLQYLHAMRLTAGQLPTPL